MIYHAEELWDQFYIVGKLWENTYIFTYREQSHSFDSLIDVKEKMYTLQKIREIFLDIAQIFTNIQCNFFLTNDYRPLFPSLENIWRRTSL